MKHSINILLFLAIFVFSGCQMAGQTNDTQIQDNSLISPKSDVLEPLELAPDDTLAQTDDQALVLSGEEESNPPSEVVIDLNSTSDKVDSVDLSVNFASQAPFAVWDEFHEETCEEASMIMVVRYFNDLPISAHIMEQELLNIAKWENENGYKVDLTAQEVIIILDKYYSTSATLSNTVSVEFIKSQLDQGNLIIVPVAGRELGNPNFSGDGPIYHMLVVRGYDDKSQEFITNDPGTRKGDGYRYNYQVLINAVHDWDHELANDGMTDAEIDMGRKILIVVSSN